MSAPNILTFFRILVAPVFIFIYLEHELLGITLQLLPWVLLVLLSMMELTDAFDGYLARRYGLVTDMGKVLDPMADNISRFCVFLSFTKGPVNGSLLVVFIIFYRESIINALRTICALKGYPLAARPSGKTKAILQCISAFLIIFGMIPYSWGYISQTTLEQYSSIILTAVALFSVISGIEYLFANRIYLKNIFTTSSPKEESPVPIISPSETKKEL